MKPPQIDHLDEVLIKRINAMVFLSVQFPRSIGYRRDAGLALLMLRGDRPGRHWFKIVREHCQLSRSQAYNLMELAAGKSLEALRRKARIWKRKSRENKWLPKRAPPLKGGKRRQLSMTQGPGETDGQSTQVRVPRERVAKARNKRHARKP